MNENGENGGGTATMERHETEPSKRPLDPELLQMQRRLKADSRPGKESTLQRDLDEMVEGMKVTNEHPDLPKDILKEKENWNEYDWNEVDKRRVRDQLKRILNIKGLKEEELNKILETALENIVASGRTVEEVEALFTQEQITEIKETANGDRNTYAKESNLGNMEFDTREGRAALFMSMGINEANVYRAILAHEFRDKVKDLSLNIPGDLIDVTWNIISTNPGEFGVNGKYPVLEMRVEKGADGKPQGRYCVNEANFILYIRSRINDIHQNEPDKANNFFGEIQFSSQYSKLAIQEMILDHPKYFSDETGVKYDALSQQVLMEIWMMSTIKQYDVEYKAVMDDGKELLKTMAGLFKYNTLTKNVSGKSLFYYMSTLSHKFNGEKKDSKLGQAWNKVFLAYFNLSDFSELQNVLGEGSDFFTREGMLKAIKEVYSDKVEMTKMPNVTGFLKDKQKSFEAAFGKNGKVIDKTDTQENNKKRMDSFIKFINYFGEFKPDGEHIKVVEKALQNTIDEGKENLAEGDKLDKHSKDVATLIAKSLIRVFGAGTKNDTGMTAFDKQVETQYTEGYRRKMASTKRGGSAGNPFTVPMFHGLSMEFLRGTRVGTAVKEYSFIDKDGKPQTETRTKTVHEVMMEMQAVSQSYDKRRDDAKGNKEELARIDAEEQKEFKLVAGELEFQENALLNWVANHQVRARQVYDQVSSGEQINFEKFTKYDSAVRGVSFDRAAFQEAVNDKLLKPLRYLFETYGELNMNMETRVLKFKGRDADGKDKWDWEDGYLGESLFGHQILDIPEFRKKANELTKKDREDGYSRSGKYVKDRDGRYVIDYDKVQDDQTLVWKQWALMKMGADLWGHISRHSTDPAYGLAHYIDVLEAIESIPGEVMGDDTDMKKNRVVTPFFSHEQIKWLRKISGTTNFKLYGRAIMTDIFTGKHRKDSLFGDSASIFIGAVFRGY